MEAETGRGLPHAALHSKPPRETSSDEAVGEDVRQAGPSAPQPRPPDSPGPDLRPQKVSVSRTPPNSRSQRLTLRPSMVKVTAPSASDDLRAPAEPTERVKVSDGPKRNSASSGVIVSNAEVALVGPQRISADEMSLSVLPTRITARSGPPGLVDLENRMTSDWTCMATTSTFGFCKKAEAWLRAVR